MRSLVRKSVRRMAAYTPGEQRRGRTVVKLNTNENPYPPSPKVRRVLKEFRAADLRRYPDPLCAKLRKKIASIHGCGERQVFVGNGSDEILALCTRAFVENAGSIGYFEPSYSLYPVLADIREASKRPVQLGPDFEWTMPEGFSASLFFVTYPNAPTGMPYPKNALRRFCARFRGVVALDEAYVDFSRRNCMDIALSLGNTLSIRSLSKSFSFAGVRVGYAVGNADLIDALFKIKDSYNASLLAQELALAALADMPHLRANVRKVVATRERVAAELGRMGFTVYPSEANFLWVKPRRTGARELYRRLSLRNILIRHFPGRRTGEYLRISIGTDDEMRLFLDAVADVEGRP